MLPRRPPITLVALFALMIPLALAWWVLVPPWEAPDGIWHWHFASHLADGGGLPRSVEEARDAPWRQEGSQPPLYYALVGLAVRAFDRTDAATAMRDNPHAAVGMATAGGNVNRVAQHDSYPAAGRWATSDWPVGVGILDRHIVRLSPATAAPCDCTATVGLYDHRTGQRVAVSDGDRAAPDDAVSIGRLAIAPAVGPDSIPSPMRIRFGNAIDLVGYRLPTRAVRAGETLPLTLYWRTSVPIATDYKVSVQLRRGAAETWGQRDEMPADGERPTSGWRRGEVVVDGQPVPVYADAPPDAYTLYVKVYDPDRSGLAVDVFGHELALAPVRVLGR